MKITYVDQPTSIEALVQEHRAHNTVLSTAKLQLLGVEGQDVYNISQEFVWKNIHYIAGRIERRDSELSSIGFFRKTSSITYVLMGETLPMMQDPCMETIDGELIIGGTEIFTGTDGKINSWHTTFYKGKTIASLSKFAHAPAKMKDVRLMKTDRIHVFSRPQGGIAGPGKIGYVSCEKLSEITPELIQKAPLLETTFAPGCWGGVNQIHALKNGLLGIVGHVATMSQGDVRHYYGMVFGFNPLTKQTTQVKIVCERQDFAPGATKRIDLIDVVFLGGMVRHPDGTATLYTGLSDAEAHCATIIDPFLELEAMSI
jgi:hypothetical protein